MNAETSLSGFGLSLLAGFLVIAVAFAAFGGSGDRDAASGIAPSAGVASGTGVATYAPNRVPAPDAADGAVATSTQSSASVQAKARCPGCGVVESIRRVERRSVPGGACKASEPERLGLIQDTPSGGGPTVAGALPAVVRDVLASHPAGTRAVVTSSYQIVVRFRDGSRRVFNEATARTLQTGERVQVIAGTD